MIVWAQATAMVFDLALRERNPWLNWPLPLRILIGSAVRVSRSIPELVHASMQALVDGGSLQDPGEPVDLIDGEMMRKINGFLFKAGIQSDGDGNRLAARKTCQAGSRIPCPIAGFGFRRVRWVHLQRRICCNATVRKMRFSSCRVARGRKPHDGHVPNMLGCRDRDPAFTWRQLGEANVATARVNSRW